MRTTLLPLAILLVSGLVSGSALAQSPPQGSSLGGGSSTLNVFALPPPPPVSDPMLTPVPPPRRLLSSWDEAMRFLRTRSTDLKIALDQVLQAEAQTRIALAQYLPSLQGTGAYTHQLVTHQVLNGAFAGVAGGAVTSSTVPIPSTYAGSLQLQQTLLNVQQFDQISIDELAEDATRLSVDDKKRTLALSVANQIVAVVTAERSAEINRVGLKVALEQQEITKMKQALGAATGLDVVRAQQNAANARASLVSGDESLREAREALGLALGISEETGVSPDVNVDGLAASAMSSCRAVPSVDERPDIAAARTNLDVAKRNLRNVYYQFLPTLNAQSTVTASSPFPNGYPNPTWNIQGILSVPVWDGGTRYGTLRNARAAEDLAAQQLEALRRQAIIQVQQAQRQLVVAEDSDRVAREQRDLSARNDQMTQTAYVAGQGTSLELVTASEAHRQAELNLALMDFGVVKARILAALALATCPL